MMPGRVWRVPAVTLSGLLVLAACAGWAPAYAAAAVVSGPLAERIDAYMSRAVAHGMAGALLVERDGAVVLSKGYGLADRERGVPIAPDTRFEIGSLGKQFTATAILHLDSKGRLSTRDTIGRWFKGLSAEKAGITVDQLLHHTSGLGYLGDYDFLAPMSEDSVLHAILDPPLGFAPGSRYQYSSPGYDLLALIVERVSGEVFEQYVHRNLFAPAGMKRSGFIGEFSRWASEPLTQSYSGATADTPLLDIRERPSGRGAGMVVSTAEDLWKWELALRQGTILPPAHMTKLFEPVVPSGPTTRYACGWEVATSQRNTTVILHAGDLAGFNSDMRRLVDEHATIIFLSNVRIDGRGCREPATTAVTRLMFGQAVDLPPDVTAPAPGWIASMAGDYRLPSGGVIHVAADGGRGLVSSPQRDGLSVLAGSDSAGRALEARLDLRAARLVAGALSGEADVDSLWHPSLPQGSRAQVVAWWRELAGDASPPTITVLGTASVPPAGGRTYIELRGARGVHRFSLSWARSLAIGCQPATDAGMEVPFLPDTPTSLASYSLHTGRRVRVSATADGRGLAIESGGEIVRAARM